MSGSQLELQGLPPCSGHPLRRPHLRAGGSRLSIAPLLHRERLSRSRPATRTSSFRCKSFPVFGSATQAASQEQPSSDQQSLVSQALSNVSAAAVKLSQELLRPLKVMLGALQQSLHQVDWKQVQAAAKQCKQTVRKTNIILAAAPVAAQGSSYTLLLLTRAMAKFVEWYLLLLFVRVLLSWFPTFDWDQQPWLAIRQLTDPYLNLFRNIIPPLLGMMDFTPLLGFIILQNLQGYLAALSARPDEDMW